MEERRKIKILKAGDLGSELKKSEKSIDLETLDEREEVTFGVCECGSPVTSEESVFRCSECGSLCCQNCRIESEGRTFCLECARIKHHGMDKQAFMILLSISRGVFSPEEISEVTGIPRESVEGKIEDIKNPLLVEKKAFFGLLPVNKSLSQEGREALSVFREVFEDDRDVAELLEELRIREVQR